MRKEIVLNTRTIEYELEYKRVKNINLRINGKGVYVSANRCVGEKTIEDFMRSKADRILKAIDSFVDKPLIQNFTVDEIRDFVFEYCEKCYPYYERWGIKKPQIKLRRMVSRWGSCNYIKGVLTFNTFLMYAPKECVEYVVWHEFTHLLVPDHSKEFYKELEKVCPDWKRCRAKLKNINVRSLK